VALSLRVVGLFRGLVPKDVSMIFPGYFVLVVLFHFCAKGAVFRGCG